MNVILFILGLSLFVVTVSVMIDVRYNPIAVAERHAKARKARVRRELESYRNKHRRTY